MRLMKGLNALDRLQRKEYRPSSRRHQPGQPIFKNWDVERAIKHGMRANTWVYRCVTMTSELASQLPFAVQRRGDNESWEWDRTHPVSKLLSFWNGDMGPAQCTARATQYLQLGGNFLGPKFGMSGGYPRELRVETPVGVTPVPNDEGGISHYDAEDRGVIRRWEREELCHGMFDDPENPYWGMSRLVAISRAVDTDVEAAAFIKRRLEVGGVPDGILVDKSVKSAPQRRSAQQALDDEWGTFRGPWVQGDGVEWVNMGMSPKELQHLDGRTFNMREIVLGFGYHPALFGEDAIFNNALIAERAKWTGGVLPVVEVVTGALTRGLLKPQEWPDTRVWYDTSGVVALREDVSARVSDFVALVGAGVPIDDAKGLVGLEIDDLPNGQGKVPMLRGAWQAVSEVLTGNQDPDAPL